MPNDDSTPARDDAAKSPPKGQMRSGRHSLFATPPPIRYLFDRTPLVTSGANELPSRSPGNRREHVLHIFTTVEDAKSGRPSFNPACLKWQAYLKFNGVLCTPVASNNHASPSGALPFLLPGASGSTAQDPVPSNKLKRWVASQKAGAKAQESQDMRYEAYASLIDHRIRRAWLYQLYLNPSNAALLHKLYVAPNSSNTFVQLTIAYQLRAAASSEIFKSDAPSTPTSTIIGADILRDAQEALEALSTLLSYDEWFFGQEKPGLFDASVFAYTELLLGEELEWVENGLGDEMSKHEGLVRHRERVKRMYF